MVLSTALSDLLLCACALLAAGWAWSRAAAASVGFALLAIAAGLGAVRYGLDESWITLHQPASFLAGAVGMPLVALAFVAAATSQRRLLMLVALLLLAAAAAVFWMEPRYRLLVGLLSLLLWLVAGAVLARTRVAIALGIGFSLLAALCGVQGQWWGLPRVDFFHVLLGLAQLGFAAAFLALSMPVRITK